MLSKSLIAVILSMPASIVIIALFLTVSSTVPVLRMPALLMVFPVWIAMASISYFLPSVRSMVVTLVTITVTAYGLMLGAKSVGLGYG